MPEPVMHKFAIEIPAAPGTHFLDIGQIASLCNRKFYRQGMNWAVGNIEFWTNGDASLHITKLPNTWTMANAWTKSFALWKESQNQVLDVDGRDILGKYADFKIFYDTDHQVNTVGGNLLPFGFATTGASAEYDWDPTTYQVPNDPVSGTTTEYEIHAIGPSTGVSLGAIAGYAASRARPQQNDPNVVDSASPEDWMTALFDTGENLEEIRQDIEDDNDSPPYLLGAPGSQLEYYPGGGSQATTMSSYIQDILVTRSGTSLTSDNSGPFLAPCGLLRLDVQHQLDAPSESILFLELVPGPVKGLMAQPMQEMN